EFKYFQIISIFLERLQTLANGYEHERWFSPQPAIAGTSQNATPRRAGQEKPLDPCYSPIGS
ncbi:hypothetical protein, partial [Dyadobacter sp. OTU695]|uniref:hypothetical protein n=1 Tax=Dyadobacter sp. OTU695 TaxID=3043860 RepID=UPI00313D377E